MTLTIQQSRAPIVKTQTIDLINPGEQKTVSFPNFPAVQFGEQATVKVDVAAGAAARRTPTTTRPSTRSSSPPRRVSVSSTTAAWIAIAAAAVAVLALARRGLGADADPPAAGGPGGAARRRQGRPRRVRRLAPGPDRRPPPRGRRDRRRPRARRPPRRRLRHQHRRSSATTPTRTPAATSRRRSPCSTRPASGIVVTAIQGRDYARIYVKELDRGRASIALSPEERRPSSGPCPARPEAVRFRCAVQQVLVLNASYEPLNVCSVRRAHVLVFKGKAEVIEELDQPLRSATDSLPVAARDPARPVRPRAADAAAQDLAPGALRPRRLALRLLRHDQRPADARPRRPAQSWAATRSGRTSSPRARPATCARATGSPTRSR